MKLLNFILIAGALCFFARPLALAQNPPDRQVAFTIDDLPAASANSMNAATITEMTTKLLATLRDKKVPAVGFVNENKLYKFGEVDERIKALRMWLDYGFELGNHAFSHANLNQVGLKAWEDDVIQGESVTRMLLAEHNMKLRYFRHPYLVTGRDLATRHEAETFLAGRGYRIAPVTLDASDWFYAGVYEDARKRGDTALQQQLAQSYLDYADASFASTERFVKSLIGYEPKQILLLHSNQLEADYIGDLIELMKKRGYRFITLEDALSDKPYSQPDTYVGEGGAGWVYHWAITQGKPSEASPMIPQWVVDRSKALGQP